MNNQENLILVCVVILILWVYIYQRRIIYILCKTDILEALGEGIPLPVEIVDGTHKVVSKISKDQISLIRIHDGKHAGTIFKVFVPPRMQFRILESRVYVFHFDSVNHEICFNDGSMHREPSDFTKEEMREKLFIEKKEVLRKINY
jgi:hypothetical protein